MLPEPGIDMQVPALEEIAGPIEPPVEMDLSRFSEFWDDAESMEQNIAAISWWLDRANGDLVRAR